MSGTDSDSAHKAREKSRAEREADALRRNLARRKAQTRARRESGGEASAPPPTDPAATDEVR